MAIRYYFNAEQKIPSVSLDGKIGEEDSPVPVIAEVLFKNSFSSQKEYSTLIRKLVSTSKKHRIKIAGSPIYSKEIKPIRKGLTLTEKTGWGGVSLKNVDVENNHIKKLLVIGALGVLGFEYHKLKHEMLKVCEGFCLVFYSNHRTKSWKRGRLSWKIAARGDRFKFLPFDEHGIVALTDCVIEERSTNHLDDLVFIYKA